jgi:hypothetical protein
MAKEKDIMESFTHEEKVEMLEIVGVALCNSKVLNDVGSYLDLSEDYLFKLRHKTNLVVNDYHNNEEDED